MRHFTSQFEPVVECLELSGRFSGLDGELGPLERYVLSVLAERGPSVGEIVVVGRGAARAVCCLAEGTRRAGREQVTAVGRYLDSADGGSPRRADAEHSELSALTAALNEAGLEERVRPIIAGSEEAVARWSKPIRLLAFLGGRSFEEAERDFSLWSRHVAGQGAVAFEVDNELEGVGRFYADMIKGDRRFQDRLAMGSLRVAQRA